MRLLAVSVAALTLTSGLPALAEAPAVRHPGHDAAWWRDRAIANRRLYRTEHRRFLAEQRHRARLARRLERVRHVQAHESPQDVIRRVFGPYGDQAVRVFSCETGGTFSTTAANGQYLGIAQFGEYARSRYGFGDTVEEQARAAYRMFRAEGWAPWECARIVGVR